MQHLNKVSPRHAHLHQCESLSLAAALCQRGATFKRLREVDEVEGLEEADGSEALGRDPDGPPQTKRVFSSRKSATFPVFDDGAANTFKPHSHGRTASFPVLSPFTGPPDPSTGTDSLRTNSLAFNATASASFLMQMTDIASASYSPTAMRMDSSQASDDDMTLDQATDDEGTTSSWRRDDTPSDNCPSEGLRSADTDLLPQLGVICRTVSRDSAYGTNQNCNTDATVLPCTTKDLEMFALFGRVCIEDGS